MKKLSSPGSGVFSPAFAKVVRVSQDLTPKPEKRGRGEGLPTPMKPHQVGYVCPTRRFNHGGRYSGALLLSGASPIEHPQSPYRPLSFPRSSRVRSRGFEPFPCAVTRLGAPSFFRPTPVAACNRQRVYIRRPLSGCQLVQEEIYWRIQSLRQKYLLILSYEISYSANWSLEPVFRLV